MSDDNIIKLPNFAANDLGEIPEGDDLATLYRAIKTYVLERYGSEYSTDAICSVMVSVGFHIGVENHGHDQTMLNFMHFMTDVQLRWCEEIAEDCEEDCDDDGGAGCDG